MVCTLKHLSLCPEMEALYLFNPENDMALACSYLGFGVILIIWPLPVPGEWRPSCPCCLHGMQNREELYGWILLCV